MMEDKVGNTVLRPYERTHFEYTMVAVVENHGRPIDTEQASVEKQRRDMLYLMTTRVNAFFDSIILMER